VDSDDVLRTVIVSELHVDSAVCFCMSANSCMKFKAGFHTAPREHFLSIIASFDASIIASNHTHLHQKTEPLLLLLHRKFRTQNNLSVLNNMLLAVGSLPAIMTLMQKTPESESGGGDTAVCFCMAAALAGLILDVEAMEVVVQRQEAAPLFENCLSLLARTLESLEPQAQVGLQLPERKEKEKKSLRFSAIIMGFS